MQKGVFPTKNGHRIIITNAGVEHMVAHPIPDAVLHEAFRKIVIDGEPQKFWKGTVEMGRPVGFNGRVGATTVDLDTPCLFALRHNRKRASRCAVSIPKLTSLITVILRRGRNINESFFVSAWTGDEAPPEPTTVNDPNLNFWCSNALIWDEAMFTETPFTSTWRQVLTEQRVATPAI